MPDTPVSLLIVVRHAPHGTSWLREALDLALVGATFGCKVALHFCDEGVMALVEGQGAGALGQKGTAPTLDVLALYDIERLYVDESSLSERGLDTEALAHEVEFAELAELVREYDRVFTF